MNLECRIEDSGFKTFFHCFSEKIDSWRKRTFAPSQELLPETLKGIEYPYQIKGAHYDFSKLRKTAQVLKNVGIEKEERRPNQKQ